jgi:hypothetical protein
MTAVELRMGEETVGNILVQDLGMRPPLAGLVLRNVMEGGGTDISLRAKTLRKHFKKISSRITSTSAMEHGLINKIPETNADQWSGYRGFPKRKRTTISKVQHQNTLISFSTSDISTTSNAYTK